jgi:hypothetical protein
MEELSKKRYVEDERIATRYGSTYLMLIIIGRQSNGALLTEQDDVVTSSAA